MAQVRVAETNRQSPEKAVMERQRTKAKSGAAAGGRIDPESYL